MLRNLWRAGGVGAADETCGSRLGYVDPETLELVGRSTQVGYYQWPSARSPDGTRPALARSTSEMGCESST
jgi:hypothetical protein